MTGPVAAIQISLKLGPALALVFNRVERFPFVPAFRRHGVGQTKGDKLDEAGLVAMWKISAGMPAEERRGRGLSILLIQGALGTRNFVGVVASLIVPIEHTPKAIM